VASGIASESVSAHSIAARLRPTYAFGVATIRGDRIRERRLAHELTQQQLAKRIGISQGHLSEVETGADTIGRETLARLVEELGESTDFYQGLSGMPHELRDFENVIFDSLPKSVKRELAALMREDPEAVRDAAAVFAAHLERLSKRRKKPRQKR